MKKVLAMVLALALLGACALAEGTLTVQGAGIVTVDADRATVSLGVREIAPDVMTAQGTVNAKLEAVIAALKAMGAEDGSIATDGIGIYPNYDYSGEVETIIGYTAYNSISVTLTDVDNVGAYIDAAFEAGANSLDYVRFFAADTGEAADQALALAVESARHKAQVLADAAGVSLGELISLNDSADTGSWGDEVFAKTEDAGRGAATEVLASKQQVSARVYLTFAITGE